MITQTSEYALRAAVFLAARSDTRPASSAEIAEAVRVPVGYLQKILRMLARDGILRVQRGSGGGFALAKVPTAISVLDVLRASDTQSQRIEQCPLGIEGHTQLCALHRLLDSEIARSERVFAATSLADIVADSAASRPLCSPARGSETPIDLGVDKRPRDAR
jgi:Rrf2 family protein